MSDEITLHIPGRALEADELEPVPAPGLGLLQAEVVAGYALETSRAATETSFVDHRLADDEIILLELEGEATLYLSPESWFEIIGERPPRGSDASFRVPMRLPLGTPQRGLKDFFIKGLKFLRIVPSGDDVAELATRKLTEKLESQLVEGPGLYRCAADHFELLPIGDDIPTDRPVVVFLHGTASSTEGSFGDLWHGEQQDIWRRHVEEQYGDQVYAFEHRTLSASPIDNALDLAERLPHGARLHLISHSRGGLVGELLCHGDVAAGKEAFPEPELARFEAERPEQGQALRRLAALLEQKEIRVERFVRVACPARGTTLASRRLDIYFSVLLNALKLIPALRASRVYAFVQEVLLGVLKRRTEPDELPGLEAMMPESPFIRLINSRLTQSNADLSVIAGDIEASGLFQTLAVLVTNLFYLEKHDLVVNTSAMSGGLPRAEGVRQSFHQGPEVSHFRYFANPDSTQKLIAGLTRPDGADAGFTPLLEATRALPAQPVARRGGPGGPVCFVLPGVFGSYLAVNGDRIWIDPISLALGKMRKLRIERDAAATDLDRRTYSDIVATLSRSHDVIPFAYDWRQPLAVSADRLAEAIRERLTTQRGTTIRLLAHSMGGLVARTMIARHADLWERMGERDGSHLLMLGTPNHGSWAIPKLFLGRERLSRILAAIDLRNNHEELLAILQQFPGLLAMLPEPDPDADDGFDPFVAATWERLPLDGNWPLPAQADLDAARRERELLREKAIDPDRMFLVQGREWATPSGIDIDDGEVALRQSGQGDGRVTWASAALPGIRTWYAPMVHGDLASGDDPEHHRALLEILTSGFTRRLPDQPPEAPASRPASRGVETLDLYPDEDDLASAAFLASPRPRRERGVERSLRLSITHGDLRYARYPIVVGHYENDVIVSAEAVLDRCLDSRLSRSRDLGLYPGRAGTANVFLDGQPDSGKSLFGALVIGLGQLGELTAATLQASMRHGVLTYLRLLHEGGFDARCEVGLSCLLVGTGSGGITMEDALSAMLRGAHDANAALDGQKDYTPLRLQSLEFVELFLDRSVQAAKMLQRLQHNAEFRDSIVLAPGIRQAGGGRERIVWSEGDDWWQRLKIHRERDGTLNFVYLTRRARAEAQLVPTQRRLIDRFIDRAVTTTRNDAEVATTLFELLVPNTFKHQAPHSDDMLLLVDETTARYPWELMTQRSHGGERPVSVQAGLIRQLVVGEFRARPAAPSQNLALVIGDPKSEFTELPGAQQEAQAVRELLTRRGYDTDRSQIRSNAERIITALYARPWRILHLAGHGVYDYPDPGQPRGQRITGMVLGNGMFLTAAEIAQMPTLPDLVFVNCCHLGRTDEFETGLRPNRLAASLATELIAQGARCVIAAGWAVDDGAALRFAEVFYQRMLGDNASFGRAVLDARRAVYRDFPGSNTWGAYQCYGDPNFRLSDRGGDRPCREQAFDFTIPREATLYLRELRQRAHSAASERLDELREELRRLLRQLPPEWYEESALLAAAAAAWGELADYDEAIRYFRMALAAEHQELDLRALEQYANMLVRRVGAQWEARGELGDDDRHQIEEAITLLQNLLALAPTSERHALLGSAWKRRALTAPNLRQQREAIGEIARQYEQAHRLSFERHGEPDSYPLLNWLQGVVVARWHGIGVPTPDFAFWLDRIDTVLAQRCRRAPDFWCEVDRINSRLTRYLAEDLEDGDGSRLEAELDGLSDDFARACRRHGSTRQHRSSIETLRFLLAMTKWLRCRKPGYSAGCFGLAARRNLKVLLERWEGIVESAAGET